MQMIKILNKYYSENLFTLINFVFQLLKTHFYSASGQRNYQRKFIATILDFYEISTGSHTVELLRLSY